MVCVDGILKFLVCALMLDASGYRIASTRPTHTRNSIYENLHVCCNRHLRRRRDPFSNENIQTRYAAHVCLGYVMCVYGVLVYLRLLCKSMAAESCVTLRLLCVQNVSAFVWFSFWSCACVCRRAAKQFWL